MRFFETALERIARILTAQWGIEVNFEGDKAFTDGKVITLPSLGEELPADLKLDMNGFLDHQIAHCRYTNFEAVGKVKNKFAWGMLQSTEDSRIEKLMIKDFPGCRLHLDPLNKKFTGAIRADWDKLPWQVRTILSFRDKIEDVPLMEDKEIEPYLDALSVLEDDFRIADSTTKLAELSTRAAQIVKETAEREMQKQQQQGRGQKGQGDEDPLDKDTSRASKGDFGEGEEDKDDENGKSGKQKRVGAIEDCTANFDTSRLDLEGFINERLTDMTKKGPKNYRPVTTKYDTVTDHSGDGIYSSYMDTRSQVSKVITPTKIKVERIFKVKENAKWKHELERGSINARALAGLASNKGYRTPFKQFTRTQTNNVAVSLVIDLSGSMQGEKIRQAKQCAIALAESLRDLSINFEVTGFTTKGNRKVVDYANSIKAKESQFERMSESLDLRVFKSFESNNLLGLTQIRSMDNNTDGECIKWSAKRLSYRKEKRKILLVFSDGMPHHAGSSESLDRHLKEILNALPKSGIEAVGIGVMSDHVEKYYPESVVIEKINELPTKVMNKLSSVLFRGI